MTTTVTIFVAHQSEGEILLEPDDAEIQAGRWSLDTLDV